MKKLYILSLLLPIYCNIFSQAEPDQTFIIKNNGDTIEGSIKYKTEFELSKSIDFGPNSDPSTYKTYYPSEIKEFCFHGNIIFKSFLEKLKIKSLLKKNNLTMYKTKVFQINY